MERNLVCSECGGNMKIGYIPILYDQYQPLFWAEGEAQSSVLFEPKIKKRYDIHAYRCEHCGFLKFYAGPADHSSEN